MSTGRVVLRVFLAGAVAKMLLIRQAESGNHPGLTHAILTYDPLATWLANWAIAALYPKGLAPGPGAPQIFEIILVIVFGLECVLVFLAVRWYLRRQQRPAIS